MPVFDDKIAVATRGGSGMGLSGVGLLAERSEKVVLWERRRPGRS